MKIFRQSKFDRDSFGLKVLINEIPRCLQHKRNTVSNVSRTTAPLLKHGLKMFFMNILSVSPNFQLLLKIVSPTGPSPVDIINQRRFLFNKKFRLLQISEISGPPKGTVDYDPIQGTTRLVIVLVSSIQKSGTRYNNLANGKEPSRTDQIGPYLKVVPNIPVGPNRNDPFHLRLI